MTEDTSTPGTFRRAFRWATTPPQAWGVYLLAVVLVWLLSFYAGTLKPKKSPESGPPPVTAPRS
ncbi:MULTISPECIES: hypothetical protein [Bradyrhizobium]|uniref:Uncharacterized protein n=1 Tax=Bradyrhizobium neotropicale TaxID=1497615 RepID=A0A176Z3V4_9BRAD|nr:MULTISPECIES: hypothetical protein [Bradyrhizobium]OAF15389.1 hypothetical protein AXW67_15505 [Bradyrhizobium neotropicale]